MESFSRRKTDKKIAKALGSTPKALKKEQKSRSQRNNANEETNKGYEKQQIDKMTADYRPATKPKTIQYSSLVKKPVKKMVKAKGSR
jgi:hypothetical protein